MPGLVRGGVVMPVAPMQRHPQPGPATPSCDLGLVVCGLQGLVSSPRKRGSYHHPHPRLLLLTHCRL